MKMINGGVTAAKGFTANGIHCGIRKSRVKRDLCLILSDRPASSAAVYTSNLVKGAPLSVTKKNLENGVARAVICNSGNANTCNRGGVEIAEKMCSLTADALGIDSSDVIVASTGVIGEPLSVEPIAAGMAELVAGLGDHNDFAAEAIMTTDVKIKSFAVEFEIGGVTCRLGGIAKGSGMIHPNLATMLVFITTDCSVSASALKAALITDVQNTFNMISIDGDTSTNDMVAVLANGASGSPLVTEDSEFFPEFMKALNSVTVALCRSIAADGEGATKLLECAVTGANSEACAKTAAKAVVCSSLTKAAMFGADANWGRVLCAVGYSGAPVDPEKIGVTFSSRAGEVEVCRDGSGVPFSEGIAKAVLSEDEITIKVDLGDGGFSATAWGCDLTYDYVKINGDYRT